MTTEYKLTPSTLSLYTQKLALKILFEHNGFNHFFYFNGFQDDDIALGLGLSKELDTRESISICQNLLEARFHEIKDLPDEIPQNLAQAYENIEALKVFLELNDVETAILRLSLHCNTERELRTVIGYLGTVDLRKVIEYLSKILDLKTTEIKTALSKNQKLSSFGLVEKDGLRSELDNYIRWGETLNFDDFLSYPISKESLISKCLAVSEAPKLTLDNFSHINAMKQMMVQYLTSVKAGNARGNIHKSMKCLLKSKNLKA